MTFGTHFVWPQITFGDLKFQSIDFVSQFFFVMQVFWFFMFWTMMRAKTTKMPNSKMLAHISDNHDEGEDNQDAEFQKCWPVRKWLWNAYLCVRPHTRRRDRWPVRKWLWNAYLSIRPHTRRRDQCLDLVSVETMYIYLGIFRGRFCRF